MTAVTVQSEGSDADVWGQCQDLPPHLTDMLAADFNALLDFANEVQAWAFERDGDTTFGEAAEHFKVPVGRIADAVSAHYWMFTLDTDQPLAARRIEHEGE